MASSVVGLRDRGFNKQISQRSCGEDFELHFDLELPRTILLEWFYPPIKMT